jgi:hypothetical protein
LFLESNKKRCETVVCAANQVLKVDGTCAASCPDYTAKSADGKRCEAVTCEGASKLLTLDGKCVASCPAYEKASNDGKKCETPAACNKKLTHLGTCEDNCPDFYKANTDANVKCVAITNVCLNNSADGKVYMKKDGTTCVKKCDDYMLTKGNECHEVTCAAGKKRTLGGKCLDACP